MFHLVVTSNCCARKKLTYIVIKDLSRIYTDMPKLFDSDFHTPKSMNLYYVYGELPKFPTPKYNFLEILRLKERLALIDKSLILIYKANISI